MLQLVSKNKLFVQVELKTAEENGESRFVVEAAASRLCVSLITKFKVVTTNEACSFAVHDDNG